MSHPEEQTWIRRAQAGEREAFAKLVDAYWNLVYRVLYGMTQNAHAAEDLTQEVFLKAWANLKSFKPDSYFRAWLLRIAHNSFLNTRRGPRYAARHQALPKSLAARQSDPVSTLVTEETQTLVEAAVNRLPPKYRTALLMRTREGLPFFEIAEALSLTAATARWHVFKARQLLMDNLAPLLETTPT